MSEPAERGQANQAACALLARAMGVGAGAVSVTSGQTSRDKTVHISGDALSLTARLETM